MTDVLTSKNRIIEAIKKRGPSLPIQIGKEVGLSTLFTSAFLSELSDEKKVKVSSLKVGGSPLYYLPGQEIQLENFYNYFNSKEAEAYLLLKENKVLKESELDPAIRVALRSIRDFAFSFTRNNESYWKYLTATEEDINKHFGSGKNIIVQEIKTEEIIKPVLEIKSEIIESRISKPEEIKIEQSKPEIKPLEIIIKPQLEKETSETEEKPVIKTRRILKTKESDLENSDLSQFNNPLVVKPVEKPKKEKPKSEFVLEVIGFINKNFKLIEEKDYKAKDYRAIVQASSELGPINFLTFAKDKKSVTDSDLKDLLVESQAIPLPALFLYTGELNKKAKEYLEKYLSILKAKKIAH